MKEPGAEPPRKMPLLWHSGSGSIDGGLVLVLKINTIIMLVNEITSEAKASKKLCKSSTPDKELGASQLASCKSQGYRSRDGDKSHKIGSKRVKMGGKKIKGKKYGGPIPDYS